MFNEKATTKTIKSIGTQGLKTRELIQEALFGCAHQAMFHGRTNLFNELAKACIEARISIEPLTRWAVLHAPVYVKNGAFAFSKGMAANYAGITEDEFAKLMAGAVKWYDTKAKEVVRQAWEADKYMQQVIKKLEDKGVSSDVIALVKDAEMRLLIERAKAEDMIDAE